MNSKYTKPTKLKIAIDGPAASGKSTTARIIAKRLGYLYIDTGAMYRALTYAVLQNKIDPQNEQSILELAKKVKIELKPNQNGLHTILNGIDITNEIRLPEVTDIISIISAYASVRKLMVEKQREIAASGGIVMDGRDIGTVVLPDAEIKIFMQATVVQRAKRRFNELSAKGINVNFEEIQKEIEKRDHLDSSRKTSPLIPAADAKKIDTSNLTIEQQVSEILKLIRKKL